MSVTAATWPEHGSLIDSGRPAQHLARHGRRSRSTSNDQALREYEHGFLLADSPLGQGSFYMPGIAAILERARRAA
jgi:hypothetical protein